MLQGQTTETTGYTPPVPTALALIAFIIVSAVIVLVWNRSFRPVPLRAAAIVWLFCAAYMAPTLFTSRVDVPADLAFVAQPWQSTGGSAVRANTGIVFTQLVPWTRVARDAIASGQAPLWNRTAAAGAPLLANQQTAIYHPFTLLGLLLPLGKAFTLSAALRLFFVAFFTLVLLRNWELTSGAAIFGAIAYAFCSFHVVWLLFPLGLSTMMLPLCLVGVQELARAPRRRAYAVLLSGLSLAVLGGHPESALWVWIVTVAFALYASASVEGTRKRKLGLLTLIASAFIAAMLLTAFFWMPTLSMLRETPRFTAMQSLEANPADHGLGAEWLLPFIAPNVLGYPANGTYAPPSGSHPAVLSDYGEVASSYAGLATLGLALAAPFLARRRPIVFALLLMASSFLTIAEAPVWRDAIRAIPLVGISIHQRLRIFWDLGVCIAAAMTVDAVARGGRRRSAVAGVVLATAAFALVYLVRRPPFLSDPLAIAQLIVPIVASLVVMIGLRWPRAMAAIAAVAVFADLTATTWKYNPPSRPETFYPVTGAIETLQRAQKPFRFAALGWSFLPDTPGYYGLEDVKTTDPIQHARYMRLMRGYLDVEPGSYDQLVRDTSQPFFDYLNVKYLYAPPGAAVTDPRFVEIYRGADGAVLQNVRALPRYFLVEQFVTEPSFEHALWRSKQIADFRQEAVVDHVPAKVQRQAPSLESGQVLPGGTVTVRVYGANETVLDVSSRGWNLLVSSDVHWPGWRAYWNGQRQPPVVVNGAFLGCFVPPGEGQLVFRYRPDEYTNGLKAAGVGVLLLAVGAAAIRLRKR